MTEPAATARPPIDPTIPVLGYARACVMSSMLDPQQGASRLSWRFAAMQVAELLTGRRGPHDVDQLDQIEAAFKALCAVIENETDLETDRDGYLNREGLPRTIEQALLVEAGLVADRNLYLTQLTEMAQ